MSSIVERLQKLDALKEAGVLNEEEYKAKKDQLVDNWVCEESSKAGIGSSPAPPPAVPANLPVSEYGAATAESEGIAFCSVHQKRRGVHNLVVVAGVAPTRRGRACSSGCRSSWLHRHPPSGRLPRS